MKQCALAIALVLLSTPDQDVYASDTPGWTFAGANDTIPADFPGITVVVNDNPAPGKIFISPISRGTPRFSYLAILDENFYPAYYQRRTGSMSDFKMHPNGLLTFFDREVRCFYAMNESYAIIDSFRCGNGFVTDGHDVLLLPNGGALLMAYDDSTINMSTIVPGGHPAARVSGLIIQELDSNKNVVFEWTSWNHFAITDATHENLTASTIDYVHANAFEIDTDGNILLSSRHMDEITKINRANGTIIWRLGGINNQFTFINDSTRFSYQHDVRRLPNGNITLFDNGNYHSPPFSRAVEYHLDEQQMTVELVWEYRNNPDIYAFATGNAQRLPNGNTFISWGTTNIITEVRPDGAKAMELILSPLFTNYRTFRFPWTTTDVRVSPPVPGAVELLPSYPNPFNPTTTIVYRVRSRGLVSLKVFDMLGQEVATLVKAIEEQGEKSVTFDAGNLASGIYFCRLHARLSSWSGGGQAGEFTQTRKMLLLR